MAVRSPELFHPKVLLLWSVGDPAEGRKRSRPGRRAWLSEIFIILARGQLLLTTPCIIINSPLEWLDSNALFMPGLSYPSSPPSRLSKTSPRPTKLNGSSTSISTALLILVSVSPLMIEPIYDQSCLRLALSWGKIKVAVLVLMLNIWILRASVDPGLFKEQG